MASALLPREKRRAAFALYAFCRVADDIVDEPGGDATRRLAEHRSGLELALSGNPDGPGFRELAWACRQFGVPATTLHELLDGVSRDLHATRYLTWEECQRYCEGVASSVGEMCAHVFGVVGGADALARAVVHARALGVAMQWTNVLRDVGEDARRGRCYLPESELAPFGLAAVAVVERRVSPSDPRWREFMALQVDRARQWYARGREGIALLERDSSGCALACAIGYESILDEIVRNDFDSLTRRASLGWGARLRVLARSWGARARPGPVPSRGSTSMPPGAAEREAMSPWPRTDRGAS